MAEEVTERKTLSPKAKKILNIVVDVVVAIVLLIALILAIFSIRSKAKGYSDYTEIFGTAYVAVASPSMDPEQASQKGFVVPEGKLEGFAEGDLIKLRLVDEKKAKQLKVGDIIAFQTTNISPDGKRVLNTHRIVEIYNGEEGNANAYTTRGDNNTLNDREAVLVSDIVGVYEGKASGIGHVMLFMGSSTGFFVCIVLPTLLIVVYCAVNLFLVVRKEKKTQTADAAAEKEAEKERMRQEILAEMQGNNSTPAPQAEEQPAQPAEESQPEQEEKEEQSADSAQPEHSEQDKQEEGKDE